MVTIAYIRVSSEKQNCSNQHYEIENFCKLHNVNIINGWKKLFLQEKNSNKENLVKF